MNNNSELKIDDAALAAFVGGDKDDAQKIALFVGSDVGKKKRIGTFVSGSGRKYSFSVSGKPSGHTPKGEILGEAFINEEVDFDQMAYFEIDGETPSGRKFVGIYYSIADADSHCKELAAAGEI